jgi:hypothetical protein
VVTSIYETNTYDYPNLMAQPWAGVVAANVVDFTALCPIIIPAFDPNLVWGPYRWQARDAVELPQQGDTCLVIFDDNRDGWVVAWWPFS